MNDVVIAIPAYRPTQDLLALVDELVAGQYTGIILVDDGSGSEYRELFEEAGRRNGVVVLRHAVNMGKGRALKTALNHFLLEFPSAFGLVTVDADGQHLPGDVLRVSRKMKENPTSLILGVRGFSSGTPLRSRIGNAATRLVFSFLIGKKCTDTQTGLRAIPARWIPQLVTLKGERYEYEMNMLIETRRMGIGMMEEPISTVYIDSNRSSHFNPIVDSFRIYFLLLRFTASSVMASLIDLMMFAVVYAFSGHNLLLSQVMARAVSTLFNFSVNQRVVFRSQSSQLPAILKYYALAVALMLLSYAGIGWMIETFRVPALAAKILVDGALFFASFSIQRDFVFSERAVQEAE